MKNGRWNRKITSSDMKHWLSDEKNSISEYKFTKNISYKNPLSSILDCHGLTVQESYEKIISFIDKHYDEKTRKITIITGKSGQIKVEFPLWMSLNKKVRCHTILNNGGSWYVYLNKK